MYSDKHDISSSSPSQPANPQPSRRGFAAMSPEQHKDIASRGGKKAHALGVAHRFTSEEAKAAGFAAPEGFEELERRAYDDTEFVFLRAA